MADLTEGYGDGPKNLLKKLVRAHGGDKLRWVDVGPNGRVVVVGAGRSSEEVPPPPPTPSFLNRPAAAPAPDLAPSSTGFSAEAAPKPIPAPPDEKPRTCRICGEAVNAGRARREPVDPRGLRRGLRRRRHRRPWFTPNVERPRATSSRRPRSYPILAPRGPCHQGRVAATAERPARASTTPRNGAPAQEDSSGGRGHQGAVRRGTLTVRTLSRGRQGARGRRSCCQEGREGDAHGSDRG